LGEQLVDEPESARDFSEEEPSKDFQKKMITILKNET